MSIPVMEYWTIVDVGDDKAVPDSISVVLQNNLHMEPNAIVLLGEFVARNERISNAHSSFRCWHGKLTLL